MPNPEYATKPPQIFHHGNRPAIYQAILDQCCHNIHITGKMKALLRYYAEQDNGWSPILKVIEAETGVPQNQVFDVRARIADKGVLEYRSGKHGNAGIIIIDWQRITIYAALTEPIRLSQADRKAHRESGYNPFKPKGQVSQVTDPRQPRIKDLPEFKILKVKTPIELSEAEAEALDRLERMTIEQYEAIFGKPKQYIDVALEEDRWTLANSIDQYQQAQPVNVA